MNGPLHLATPRVDREHAAGDILPLVDDDAVAREAGDCVVFEEVRQREHQLHRAVAVHVCQRGRRERVRVHVHVALSVQSAQRRLILEALRPVQEARLVRARAGAIVAVLLEQLRVVVALVRCKQAEARLRLGAQPAVGANVATEGGGVGGAGRTTVHVICRIAIGGVIGLVPD